MRFVPAIGAILLAAGPLKCGRPHARSSGGERATSAGLAADPIGRPGVRWIGRVDERDPSAVRFAWSGSGLDAVVYGSRIAIAIGTRGEGPVFFQPVIDGRRGTRFSVPSGAPGPVVLASGVAAIDHRVELIRETESSLGDSVFAGFVEGVLRAPPAAPGRLIEIVGDSISAGYGNLGMESHDPEGARCTFSPETESAYASYGWVLARSLGADASIIARSGWGVVHDYAGRTDRLVPSIYDDVLGTRRAPAWSFALQPDAVVVNLGTNDSTGAPRGDPGSAFEAAYATFLRHVRGHYPRAWIFLTIGPMTREPALSAMREHLARVAAEAGDARVTTVEIPPQDPKVTGCDFHPDVDEDRTMAAVLAKAMKARLGW